MVILVNLKADHLTRYSDGCIKCIRKNTKNFNRISRLVKIIVADSHTL